MILKSTFKNKKALSPLITTILLIVVTFALIGIVLSWGKNFTSSSLSQSTNFADFKPSDSGAFLTIDKGLNGRFLAEYNPPSTMSQDPITITYYSLLGDSPVPLEPPVTIPAHAKEALDLGIVNSPFDLVLYLDNNTMITKTGLTTVNKYPTDCPEGYIPVPGNFLYGTTYGSKMGFCVAKYNMKMDASGNGIGDTVADYPDCDYVSPYNEWSYHDCLYSNNLVSTKEGSPISNISQTESIAACEAIGGHLITNNEWMTIARNIEMVPNNWSSGIVGKGYIYSGYTDSGVERALEASTDDNGYYGTEQNEYERRTLILTNGEVIWDLYGNVAVWTNDTIQRKDEPDGFNSDGSAYNSYFTGLGYSKNNVGNRRYLKSDDLGNTTLKYKDLFLLTSGNYNSTNRIGEIFTYSNRNDTSTTLYAFLRGGSWEDDYRPGILRLDLSNNPSTRLLHMSLRCVK